MCVDNRPSVKPHSLRHKAETTDSRAKTDPATRVLQLGKVFKQILDHQAREAVEPRSKRRRHRG